MSARSNGTGTSPASTRPSRLQTLRRLLGYLLHAPGKLAVIVILVTVGVISFLATSVLFGRVIDVLNGSKEVGQLAPLALTMAVSSVLCFVTLWIQFRLLAQVAQQALYRLRRGLFEHMMTLSLGFFDKQPIGQLMSSVTNDIDAVTGLLQGPLSQLLMGSVMLTAAIIAMLILDLRLAVVALLIIPVLLLFSTLLGRVAGATFSLLQERLGTLNGLLEESIAGERTIIAYRHGHETATALDLVSTEVRDAGAKAMIVSLLINPITGMVAYIGLALVALIGSAFAARGSLALGTLAAFLSITQLFIIPLFQVFTSYDSILSAIAGAERIFRILDEVPTIVDRPNAVPLKPVQGHVRFEHVDFSYVPGRTILRDNSFEALPGQKIGLCGPTGAGKSTIINLLTRYYDIDSGQIAIDDQSIYDVTQASLHQQVGVVLQEAFLFSDTVMANLAYARAGVSEEECIDAARRANCHDFIVRLPQGYQTVLSERGSNLSQGQRQLLTIARAMVSDPRILILDEATSNVDTRTERAIQEALRELQRGRTSFVIAHRLSTIRDSDLILVINQGEIVERGTHDQMMASRGFYYDLYMSQFKGRIADILPAEPPTAESGAAPSGPAPARDLA